MNQAKLVKFREIRKKKGLKLSDIASELNVSKAYVSMMETGKRSLDYTMAIKMAKIFDVKPDELFYEDVVRV